MPTGRRTHRRTPPRDAITADHGTSFPRAVPGEDYDRYARAMIWQGERWLRAQLAARSAVPEADLHELRDVLRASAVAELKRDLYEQEERLLSELLHHRAVNGAGVGEPQSNVVPEIPSFLLRRTPR